MQNPDRLESKVGRYLVEQASQDLAANVAGQLTDNQQRRLAREVGSPYRIALIVVGCLLVPACMFTPAFLFTKDAPSLLVAAVLGYVVLLLLIAGALFGLWAMLVHEVKAEPIEQATGQIILQRGVLVAQVPGRKLALGELSYYGPGDYVFYFLPRYGRILSAELAPSDQWYSSQPAPSSPTFTTSEPQQPAMTDDQLLQALAKTNGFSMNDLANFRQGRLGAAALRQLWRACGDVLLLLVLGAVLAGLIWLVAGSIVEVAHNTSQLLLSSTWVTVLFVALLFAAFAWVTWPQARDVLRTALDLLDDKVTSADGEVVANIGARQVSGGRYGGSYSARYYVYQMYHPQQADLRLNVSQWEVSKAAYNALVEGRKYRVYYLPRNMVLVGIEPLRA